ncbi:nucleocapsid protein [Tuhoko virus 1]|uniref:Nucleocapsid n=1 Tax=Tuhoko virus 1 TaxID=798072 RepID=D8WJ22_9MONO|nr:nucleocapsid protein [Tuhoko virus 1]ADI80709.1 nucleocapsid protein [Tuhoko virus 1]
MSSVFKAYELFNLEQEQQERGNDLVLPPETLRSNIRVFVLNTQDPEIRFRMMCFCIRLVASNSARSAHRTGALLTLLSLPTAAMQNHIRIADRSPDAEIERIEIEGFEQGSYKLIPNARTPMSPAEITALDAMATDLPDSIMYDTPFMNMYTEAEGCDEIEEFLEAVYSVLIQVWITVCKCMTAYDQPTGSDEKRMAKYQQQGRLDPKYTLQQEVRRLIQKCIRGSLPVRQFLAFELQTARKQGTITSKYYSMVGDISKYIENAGMSAFFMTARYALGTRWAPLALAAFTGDLLKMKSLMLLYRKLGEKARFMALLEMPDMMEFAPANYNLLYSYAMGIGSVMDAQMRNYNFARPFLNTAYFQLGVETANKQQGAVDKNMAAELGLSEDDKRVMAQTVSRLTGNKAGSDNQDLMDMLSRRSRSGQTRALRMSAQGNQAVDGDEEDDEEEEEEEEARDLTEEEQKESEAWLKKWKEIEAQRHAAIEAMKKHKAARTQPSQMPSEVQVHNENQDVRGDLDS